MSNYSVPLNNKKNIYFDGIESSVFYRFGYESYNDEQQFLEWAKQEDIESEYNKAVAELGWLQAQSDQ